MSEVEREVDVPATAEEVWESLADPRELSEWFGACIEGDVALGEVTTFTWPDGTQRRAIVERMDEPRALTFRWLPYERDADGRAQESETSRVEIALVPTDEGTRIRVTETLIEAAVSPFPQIGFRPLARV